MPAKYVRPYSQGAEERLQRCRGDRRSGAAADDEVRRDQDRRSARPAGAASGARAAGQSQRTGIINQIRAFLLERGIAVRQGSRFLRAELPIILATRTDVLSPRMLRVIEDLAGDWRRLDERIEKPLERDRSDCPTGCWLRAPDERAGHRPDHLQRDGRRDRLRRRVLEGPRLRRLARAGAEADVDGRPHDPGQDLEARQSLPARAVRAGGVGRADQAEELGAPRAQALDRGGQEAAAPQRAGDRTRQQARPHRLGVLAGSRLRGEEDRWAVAQPA